MSKRPNDISSVESDFNTTVAKAIIDKAHDFVDYFDKAFPVGMIMFFYGSQPSITQPNGAVWQFCDGSTVNNPDSPINGQVVPDLRGKFLTHVKSAIGATGGNNSISVDHYHGTSITSDEETAYKRLREGTDMLKPGPHSHTTPVEHQTYNIDPPAVELQAYIRIV